MNADMTRDILAEQSYGKAALAKIGNVPKNFRLYEAGWIEDNPAHGIMRVSGAEFRKARSGPNEGKLSVLLAGTERTVYVTQKEIEAHK